MPELPEVETIRRELAEAGLVGRAVVAVQAEWPRMVGGDAMVHRQAIVGARIQALERRGKFIIIGLGRESLVVHLRMSGRLWLVASARPPSGYERVIWSLDDGRELRLHDPRMFARALLCPTPPLDTEPQPGHILHGLGVEPLDAQFSVAYLRHGLAARRRQLKPLLLDQRALVAGIGNIYANEALWHAKLHPQQLSHRVSRAKTVALHLAIRLALEQGIRNLGASLGRGQTNFSLASGRSTRNQEQLAVYGRAGQPCLRCTHPIERMVVAQRSTYMCPRCQRIWSLR